MNKIFERKNVNLILPFSFNICFGCSKEPSHVLVEKWDILKKMYTFQVRIYLKYFFMFRL